MKVVLQTLVLAFFVAAVCPAQEKCKAEGSVKDASGHAISSVSITIKSALGTGGGSTDKEGKYSVSVLCTEQSKHTITPSKTGYTFSPTSRPWDKYSGPVNFTGKKAGK
jgi:hypothetical protein